MLSALLMPWLHASFNRSIFSALVADSSWVRSVSISVPVSSSALCFSLFLPVSRLPSITCGPHVLLMRLQSDSFKYPSSCSISRPRPAPPPSISAIPRNPNPIAHVLNVCVKYASSSSVYRKGRDMMKLFSDTIFKFYRMKASINFACTISTQLISVTSRVSASPVCYSRC